MSFLCGTNEQDCWTALISASKEGHIDVVKELLANNANLENRDMVRADRDILEYSELSHSLSECLNCAEVPLAHFFDLIPLHFLLAVCCCCCLLFL